MESSDSLLKTPEMSPLLTMGTSVCEGDGMASVDGVFVRKTPLSTRAINRLILQQSYQSSPAKNDSSTFATPPLPQLQTVQCIDTDNMESVLQSQLEDSILKGESLLDTPPAPSPPRSIGLKQMESRLHPDQSGSSFSQWKTPLATNVQVAGPRKNALTFDHIEEQENRIAMYDKKILGPTRVPIEEASMGESVHMSMNGSLRSHIKCPPLPDYLQGTKQEVMLQDVYQLMVCYDGLLTLDDLMELRPKVNELQMFKLMTALCAFTNVEAVASLEQRPFVYGWRIVALE